VGTSSSASDASSAAAAAAAASASATTAAAAATFATSLADWPVFPDTTPALAKLASTLGLKLVVLSNVDRASFAHTRAALEQGFTFAAAFTAEEIGSYKLRLFVCFFPLRFSPQPPPSIEVSWVHHATPRPGAFVAYFFFLIYIFLWVSLPVPR
jgi:hypothetical protein